MRIHIAPSPETTDKPYLSFVKQAFSTRRLGGLALAFVFLLLSSPLPLSPANAQSLDPQLELREVSKVSPAVSGQISILKGLDIAPKEAKVNLKLRDASLRDVLHLLAKQGNFNIILDESVDGTITVDLVDISINKALQHLFTIGDLSFNRDGDTLLVASTQETTQRELSAKSFKTIPVLYKDAAIIAQQLNSTLFRTTKAGTTANAIASFDPDSNSLLILGSENDIELVREALKQLDIPRNRRVYRIQHGAPAYIAQVLAANFFGLGANQQGGAGGAAGGLAGGGAAGGLGGGAAGGAGGAAGGLAGGGAAGGVAGGAGGAAGGLAGGGAAGGLGGGAAGGAGGAAGGLGGGAAGGLGGGGAAGQIQAFTFGGVTFIPEPISSTLTVLGTAEQLALVDSLIEEVDVRRPQVSIDVSLVELSLDKTRTSDPSIGNFGVGEFQFGILGASGVNSLSTGNGGVSFSIPDINYVNQLTESKGRILANPTIVALDGTQSTIDITDQVVTFTFTVTPPTDGSGVPTIVPTPTVQDVGISLSITPQVSNDGSVTLNIAPDITQLVDTAEAEDATGNIQQVPIVATRSLNIGGVRVRDGETLAIGGLLQETRLENLDQVPGLSKLPIVGALFRATGLGGNTQDRTELVILVTPHILKDDAVTYFENGQPHNTDRELTNPNRGAVQPVSLPRFTEDKDVSGSNAVKPIKLKKSDTNSKQLSSNAAFIGLPASLGEEIK